MLFAMVKHVSGLLATTFLTARAIPDVGFFVKHASDGTAAIDPVSQYVFMQLVPTIPITSPYRWHTFGGNLIRWFLAF
jgi:hypothetical protein